jgi:hypothetical protein
MSSRTVNSPRTTPNVFVLPKRWTDPGSQFSCMNLAISSVMPRV